MTELDCLKAEIFGLREQLVMQSRKLAYLQKSKFTVCGIIDRRVDYDEARSILSVNHTPEGVVVIIV